jgi:hypothetical protein
VQAHLNAQQQNEEFITDLFISAGKVWRDGASQFLM